MERALSQKELVTAVDLLQAEKELEAEAEFQKNNNWGDENVCTYEGNYLFELLFLFSEGYVRQPVYGCLTCMKTTKESVTKRKFRSQFNVNTSLVFVLDAA
jgi:hypothetical protein